MILTINANAAIDRIFFIPRFVPNTHMRTVKAITSVGGKALDASLVLRELGAPLLALSFIAGKNGEVLAGLLEEQGIPTDLVWLPGETRVSTVIVETELNRHSHITTAGYTVTPADSDAFLARVDEHARAANGARPVKGGRLIQGGLIGGSLPGGAPVSFYRQVIERLHRQGVPVLIDGFGPPLRECLPACPDVVKMNQSEFLETFQVDDPAPGGDDWVSAWAAAIREQMVHHSLPAMTITCGKDGILAVTPQAAYHAGCPEVKEVNAAGAGDAASAAIAYRLMLGDPWPEVLRWAVAASAAVVKTEGTAECHMADVLEIYPTVWVREI